MSKNIAHNIMSEYKNIVYSDANSEYTYERVYLIA